MTDTRPTRLIDIAWSALLLSLLLALMVGVSDHFRVLYTWFAAPYLQPIFLASLAYRSAQDPFTFMTECAFVAWTALFGLLLVALRSLGLGLRRSLQVLLASYALYAAAESAYWQRTFEAVERCQGHGGAWDWEHGVCGEKLQK